MTEMIKVDFYRDEHGAPRATADSRQHIVADFLESDIQGDSILCREMIDQLTHTGTGWEWVGNAHSIRVSNNKVYIEGLFEDDTEFVISIQELVKLLLGWLSFLQSQ